MTKHIDEYMSEDYALDYVSEEERPSLEGEIVEYPQEYEPEGSIEDNIRYYVESAKDIGQSAETLLGLYSECRRVREQTKQVQAWSQAEIVRTVARYKSCQDFLDKTFGERDMALTKHYDLLDKAVASNDKELILVALSGISSIVTKSPLEDFEKLVELYDDTSKPLLDF